MEKLPIKIIVGSEWFNKPPKCRITVNKQELFFGEVSEDTVVEDTVTLEPDSEYQLGIELLDKNKYDTQIDSNGNITKDTLLKLKLIELDDIDVLPTASLNQTSFYYEHDGEKTPLYNVMGRNGTSIIKFTTPFYIWLLDNI